MSVSIPAAPGHCLSTISDMYRFPDYRTIYDHANNQTLRRDCPNPNQVSPNTMVFIPDRQEGGRTVPVTQVHNYTNYTTEIKLRLVLVDSQDHPYSGKDWEIVLGSVHRTGTTASNGLAETQVRANFTEARFKVRLPHRASASGSPTASSNGGSTPPYPPPVHTADFTDPYDATYTCRPENEVEWTLEIGSLAPHKVIEGVKARLNNLGFEAGGVDAADTPDLRAAVTAYQRVHQLTQSGAWHDIADHLRNTHDVLR